MKIPRNSESITYITDDSEYDGAEISIEGSPDTTVSPIGTSGYNVDDSTSSIIDSLNWIVNPISPEAAGGSGDAGIVPTVFPNRAQDPFPETKYKTIIVKNRYYINDYSQENLYQLYQDGGTFYVIYSDRTEDEVDYTEIYDPYPATTNVITFEADDIGAASNQYFWDDDNGAHVTDSEKNDWLIEYEKTNHGSLNNPTDIQPWHNILMNSLGILLRRGLLDLISISKSAIAFYDGYGNQNTNITAFFGRNSAQIGKDSDKHLVLSNDGITVYNGDGTVAPLNASNITAAEANITNLQTTKANVTDLNAATARITSVEADTAKIHNLTADDISAATAYIEDLITGNLTASSLLADNAKIHNITANELSTTIAYISTLIADSITAADITADHAQIATVVADYLKTSDMEAEVARVGTLLNGYMQTNLANANVAWIQNGSIKDGSITNAMINSVSANKLTAGTIDASNITVTNLNADNITTGTINGQRIGTGSLSLDKLSDDVYTETEVDNLLSTMQTQIDGAIETWTGTETPTLSNAPASSWNTNAKKDTHIGDVYFVVNSNSQQNGYNYRFTKSGNTYSWQLIKDSDVTNALSRLTTAEGKIGTIEQFDSDISSWKTSTDNEISSIKSNHTALAGRVTTAEGTLTTKVDTSTFNTLSQTVGENTSSITSLTTRSDTIENNAKSLNMSPFYSSNLKDVYNSTTNPDGYWREAPSSKVAQLTDGWAHITLDNTSGSSTIYEYVRPNKIEGSIPSTATALIEIRNFTSNYTDDTTHCWFNPRQTSYGQLYVPSFTNIRLFENGNYYIPMISYSGTSNYFVHYAFGIYGGYSASFDVRISIYNGSYSGPYKPYVYSNVLSDMIDILNKTDSIEILARSANLSPFYSSNLADLYNSTTNPDGYWRAIPSNKVTRLTNGWAHITLDNTSGSSTIYEYVRPNRIETNIPEKATLLLEIKNFTSNYNDDVQHCYFNPRVTPYGQLYTSTSTIIRIFENSEYYIPLVKHYNSDTNQYFIHGSFAINKEYSASFDVRISVYEGEYTGSYKPYVPANAVGDISEVSTRVSTISQNLDGITTRIGSVEETIVTKADGSTVTNISNNLNSITETVNGHTQSISTLNTTVQNKADSSTVTTLSGTVNTITDTVNGHTSQISSINQTQSDIRQSAVKSTVQLWFTKNSTAAPNKPTSHITTNSSATSNSWNLAVPVYNSSYPYYFYCYEYQFIDGSYGWSAVTRDIATEETQSNSRNAQTTASAAKTTANKNVKESIQLWFTKADTTAPDKPTSAVTSTSTSGNGWRTVVPTYTATYPYYYYCIQYKLADGTYTWSDVVYDQSTTEANRKRRTFTSTPTVPYDIGDIWVNGSVVKYATVARNKTQSYVSSDWSITATDDTTATAAQTTANKNVKESIQLWYTKADTTAPTKPTTAITSTSTSGNAWRIVVPTYSSSYPYYYYCIQYKLADDTYTWSDVVYDRATTEAQSTARTASSDLASYITSNNTAIQTLQNQVDGQIEAWYKNVDPTNDNAPASSWTDNSTKARHEGDLYYNVTNGHSWRWLRSGTATSPTYSWQQIPDSDASAALAAAQDAQTTANGKRRIFTTTPTAPYDAGDLWVNGSVVKYATTSKSNSQSYNVNDWSVTATDDTAADAAQATANKNVKESVQLWYTNSTATTPIKPTTVVTSSSTSGGAWRTVVPTYSSSYPYYYYCMQYKLADGTYTWSDVVYDQATTEAQSVARTVTSNFETLQNDYANFKQTTNEFESTIGTTYATKSEVNGIQYGGRNLLRSTGSPSYETVTLSNSTVQNDKSIRMVPTTSGAYCKWKVNYLDYSEYNNNIYTFSLEAKLSEVSTTYESISLRMFIGFNLATRIDYNFNNSYDRYSAEPTYTDVDSSWKKFYIVKSIPTELVAGQTGALVNGSQLTVQVSIPGSNKPIDIRNLKLERGNKPTDWTPAPEDMASGTALSLLESRVSTNETSIQQNNQAIALKANSSDVYTKTQTDGLISTEVSNRNAAIQLASDNITSSVASTYSTKTEMASSTRNLLYNTLNPKVGGVRSTYSNGTIVEGAWYVLNAESTLSRTTNGIRVDHAGGANGGIVIPLIEKNCLVAGETVTLSFDYRGNYVGLGKVFILCDPIPNLDYGTAGISLDDSETWAHYERTLVISDSVGDAKQPWAILISYYNSAGKYLEIKDGSMMLERGDMAKRMTLAETAIVQNADDILLRATKSEAYQLSQPNLSPFFEAPLNDSKYWVTITNLISYGTTLNDGWVHLTNCGVNLNVSPKSSVLILNPSTTYTVVCEVRNATMEGSISCRVYTDTNSVWSVSNNVVIFNGSGTLDYTKVYITGTTKADLSSSSIKQVRTFFSCNNGGVFNGDVRISIFEDEYNEGWKPYYGTQLFASQSELKIANDSISTKVSSNGVISAINQSAEEIQIQASRVAIDGSLIINAAGEAMAALENELSIGGRNLLRKTDRFESSDWYHYGTQVSQTGELLINYNNNSSSARYAKYLVDYLDYSEYGNGTYTVSWEAMEDLELASGTSLSTGQYLRVYFGYQPESGLSQPFASSRDKYRYRGDYLSSDGEWKRYSSTFVVPTDLDTGTDSALATGSNLTVEFYRAKGYVPVRVRRIKIERGDTATPWTAAPEDLGNVETTANTANTNASTALSTANTANTNATNAAKTATNYIVADSNGIKIASANPGTSNTYQQLTATSTDFIVNGSNELSIGVSNNTPFIKIGSSNTYQKIQGTSSEIFINGTSQMLISPDSNGYQTVRIGQSGHTTLELSSKGYIELKEGSNPILHFGYGSGLNLQGGYSNSPYYTFGTRSANGAIGNYSTTFGSNNTASGYSSFAEGWLCSASGKGSHAQGTMSSATGAYSWASGYNSVANNTCSIAMGYNLIANGYYQTVMGSFNAVNTTDLFIIGGGREEVSSSGNTIIRENIFRVSNTGTVTITGTYNTASDARAKTLIDDINPSDGTDFIMQLNPKKYYKNGKKEMGFYAQEVEETNMSDYLVTIDDSENYDLPDYRLLDYNGFIAPMVAAIQDLELRIESLETKMLYRS